MNRPATALLAALDAVIVVAIGVGIPLIPLTVLWATQFGLAIDWLVFWRASADIWLAGNGVDLLLTIDPALALRLGLAGADQPFELGLAPLGFALVTVLLGLRSGRRLGQTRYPITGGAVGVLVFALLALAVSLSARDAAALPSIAQSILFPAAVYALGLLLGYGWAQRRVEPVELGRTSRARQALARLVDRVDQGDRGLVALALRAGAISAAGIVGFAAVAMALVLVFNFSSIVGLYESLQAGVLGGITLTLGQLALLPNIVLWTVGWFVGPGFALGTGSSVSPLGTQLGLVPSLPIFGALPDGTPAFGFVGLLVPIVVGFGTAALLRPAYLDRIRGTGSRGRIVRLLATAIGGAAVGSSILALLTVWAGGAAGPGRLADVGADPGLVWLWSFIELAVAMLLGLVGGATWRTSTVTVASARRPPADTL
ncbi:cell division protein PerM [Herbiconiux liangxiaofengii]|uniref:cell division protein PerM n=1 Tax=Herbiconiux liangxiaofengii TaxID=3342795 RepID=UPI0035BB3D4D